MIPTLLRAAGVQPTPTMQGRSFLPLLDEHTGNYQERPSALTESKKWKAVRNRDYRYVLYPDGSETLYDLRNDPSEYHSVANDPAYAAILSDLRKELARRAIETQRRLPNPWSY